MARWLRLLQSRYALAWAASETGDAHAYAAAAKRAGYYTATLESYYAGLATWLRIYQRRRGQL